MKRNGTPGFLSAFLLSAVVLWLPQIAKAAIKIDHWTSPSGAKVLFVETHALPILDVNIDFRAGSVFDPKGKEGLSGLTATLIKLGCADLDENQVSEQLADLGARVTIQADNDRVGVSLRTLSVKDKREAALALLTKITQKPVFSAAILKRERDSAIAALKDALTRPDTIASRTFWSAIYPDHPYGLLTLPESLANITRDDVVAFYRDYFSANNAVVSIVGDINRAQAEALAEQITSALQSTSAKEARIPEVMPPPAREVRVPHHATQAHLLLGMPALKRGDPDFFALTVGNYILGGGGFVSRLMQEVREKRGLAYSVYSYFMPLMAPGPFQIGLQTKREQTEEALKVVNDILDRFLAEGPSEEELLGAKQYLTGSFPLRLDSNSKILGNVAVIGFYGLPLDWLDRYAERIEAVTAADVRAVFSHHVKRENLITVILAGQ